MVPLSTSLNRFIILVSQRALPYKWKPVADAPETFEALKAETARLGYIPVSTKASGRTIYGDARVNIAMRAWHDATHLANNLDFSPYHERLVAEKQCAEIHNIRDKALLWADTAGQVDYYAYHRSFPDDQRSFVLYWLATGNVTRKF
jgi:hypothetical protein